MPYPIHSFEHYYSELTWRVTPPELLDVAIQKGADVASIFNAVRHEDFKTKKIVTYFRYEWQLLILGGVDFDLESQKADYFMQKDNRGKTPAHYFALSGNLHALNYIMESYSDLLEVKDNTGRTIAHCAAWSGHLDTLDWIIEKRPALLTEKDDNGMTVAHWAAESGQRETLYWIEAKYPALLWEKTINGCTIAHLAAESYCPEALDWIRDWSIKVNYIELLMETNDSGMTIVHGAACSEYPELLGWIKTNYPPELLEVKTINGCTIAHFAAWTGHPRLLDWIRSNELIHLISEKDIYGRTIAHWAAESGHRGVLDWIKSNCPSLLSKKDSNGYTIAHVAMRNGHFDTLDWIQDNKNQLIREKNNDGFTVAHVSIDSEHIEKFTWIQINSPELIHEKANSGRTIAHMAAKLGHIELLARIKIYHHQLLTGKDLKGHTIAHLAAESGKVEVLDWLKANCHTLMREKDNDGRTIAHGAACSGRIQGLAWVKDNFADLLTEKDNQNRNIAHFAAYFGRVDIIDYLLQECPSLFKTLWVRDKNGNTPHAIAKKDMAAKPNQLRDNELLAATNRQIERQPKPNDTVLLLAFQDEWREILLKQEGYNLQNLVNSALQFPRELQSDIITLIPILELMAFSFDEGLITRERLQELLRLTSSAIPSRRSVFFIDHRPILIQQLQTFSGKLGLEPLTDKQILCLQLIVQDYEQRLLDKGTSVTNILVKKLLTSATLGNLRPKAEITAGMDIRVENFPAYFKTFAERVAMLPLNNSEAKTMCEIVLPGIESIIRDEDAIVQHVTTHEAEIYFLNGNMPLHTDHAPTADADAYRQTLRHLLINLFGAIEIAHTKGRLSEFCGKISSGNCLEGRVRDAFTWVASLTEIVSFEDLMHRYIHQEYVPYTEVMFGVSAEGIASDHVICDFIMARHKNMRCLVNSIYAPAGEVTQSGVSKYLAEVLGYTFPAELSLAANL